MLLSSDSTLAIVEIFVEKYGNNEAAKRLTAAGFRSPEGRNVTHAQIHRIVHGTGLRLHDCPPMPECVVEERVEEQKPEVEPEEPASRTTIEAQWDEEELSGEIPKAYSPFSGGAYIRLYHTP